jgi:hypothetical protein
MMIKQYYRIIRSRACFAARGRAAAAPPPPPPPPPPQFYHDDIGGGDAIHILHQHTFRIPFTYNVEGGREMAKMM